MLNDLMLLTGNDIPFPAAQITIHQPTIKEIGLIGEEQFFTGHQILNFSKDILAEEDKVNLEDKSNFDILIAILREQNAVMQYNRNCAKLVLALIFPEYEIFIEKDKIKLVKESQEYKIDNSNYEEFKQIIGSMFEIKSDNSEQSSFNPSGALAKKIADKLKKRQQTLLESKPKQKIDILSRYISILSVGLQESLTDLSNYTVYQLFDKFKRYELKMGYDIYVQAKMAGAKDLKEVEDWMKDIHS
jgi:hypothetical protein